MNKPYKTTKSSQKADLKTKIEPSNGARTGMLINNAVLLAMHNNATRSVKSEDLEQAYELVKDLTMRAESQ